MRILVIEPNRIIAQTYKTALEADGCDVVCATTAQSAIQAADTAKVDAVILNISLARHNGIEFLYEFKSYIEWRDVPVVLLIPSQQLDLADSVILREQLGVRGILPQRYLTLSHLCKTVKSVTEAAA